MTAEKLSEALSFLDDDIIEEAEDLRSRKPNHKIIWLRCLSAAACLCIVLVAVLGGLQANPDLDLPGLKGEEPWAGPPRVGGYTYGAGCMGITNVNENFWYYVEIIRWENDGFYGVIRGAECEGSIIPIGEKVKVKFADTVWIIKNTEESAQRVFGRIPDENDFPVGSLIKVKYFGSKTSDGNYNLWTAFLGELAPWETEPIA